MTNRLKTIRNEVEILPGDIRSGEISISNIQDQRSVSFLIQKAIEDSCIMYFGVHPTQIMDEVIDKVVLEVMQKYAHLSISELAYCYERIPIEKTVVITVNDLLDPIKKYLPSKNIITIEGKRLEKELEEIAESEKRAAKSLELSIEFYNQCLKDGRKWDGCVFRSMELAKSVLKNKLPEDFKEKCFASAKIRMIHIQSLIDKYPDKQVSFFGYTWKRVAAKKYVTECIKRKIKI